MKIIKSILLITVLLSQGCSLNTVPYVTGYAPRAADSIAAQLDEQVMQKGRVTAQTVESRKDLPRLRRELRESITVMATVPVNINNLEVSCAFARQMSEEVTRWMVSQGYKFQELRKGKEIYFQKKQGEMLLTRDPALLAKRNVSSLAVLTGTYVITPDQVRFSMRLVHTPSNEVIAMGTATVPITPDLRPLLVDNAAGPVEVEPSVHTKL